MGFDAGARLWACSQACPPAASKTTATFQRDVAHALPATLSRPWQKWLAGRRPAPRGRKALIGGGGAGLRPAFVWPKRLLPQAASAKSQKLAHDGFSKP